jgi:eukaryotic-like serine/threonine-protein kinase
MTSPWGAERWHAATAQLDQLLELPGPDREARLAALRHRDARLAADVSDLLRDHQAAQAEGFLEQDAHALLTATAAADGSFAITRAAIPAPLPPGAPFGRYRVVRILGRGGMGIVYEAEEQDSGRRVALKVLQQRLGDERERERFEREGRLAASIDHEHCVFVFGATDVRGTPAIAMELMQGTLADRLAASGPMAPAAAVDVTLQLIEGLEAAAEAGILHRDVKPSNCFLDADGTVKIGDFGISRSIRPAEETALSTRGQLTGTPTYAPPEQLRGATLDVRADIYSLGATLYELVTGRRPFTAPDLMALLMAVANDPPEPPHEIAPALPRGLSEVILRCLAKKPAERFGSYAALVGALAPYQSIAPTPATLGRRFVAGVIDQVVLGLFATPISLLIIFGVLRHYDASVLLGHLAFNTGLVFLYYGVGESVWRRTPGKALLGLTIVDTDGRPARAAAGWGRAALYAGSQALDTLAMYAVLRQPEQLMEPDPVLSLLGSAVQLIRLALTFSTVRRRNGYAAVHDLVTRTRVAERRPVDVDDRHTRRLESDRDIAPTEEFRGSFAVLRGGVEGRPDWRPGIDDRLRRPVWIRDVPPGTPPVSSSRAALSRGTRLRWLAGRRAGREAWDVFEGVRGVPLTRACAAEVPWAETRRWLTDLAQELAEQGPHDRPPLTVDRIWVADTGRVKLLDDPALDDARPEGEREVLPFLAEAVRHARAASRDPWPLSAQRFADALAAGTVPSIAEAARTLEAIGRGRTGVSAALRRLSIAAVLAFPFMVTLIALIMSLVLVIAHNWTPLDARVAARALHELSRADRGRIALTSADREAIERTLATRYRSQLGDPRFLGPGNLSFLSSQEKAIAERILRRPADRALAAGPPPTLPESIVVAASKPPDWAELAMLVVGLFYLMLAFIGLLAVLLAPTVRGLLLRFFGLEVVTADGRPASRVRLLARAALAWSPVLLPLVAVVLGRHISPTTLTWAALPGLAVGGVGMVALAIRPARGWHDRLAGTWIVPR